MTYEFKFYLNPLGTIDSCVIRFDSILTSNVFSAIDPFNNKVTILTNSRHINDCDEDRACTNNAACVDTYQTTTQDFSIDGENNKVTSDIKIDQFQKYDENTSGSNNAECIKQKHKLS